MSINKRYRELTEKRNAAQKVLNAIDANIEDLRDKCEHPNIVDDWGTGICPDCGFKTRGWFCPDSPTYECKYYDEEEHVYDEDCCIYCRQPNERK